MPVFLAVEYEPATVAIDHSASRLFDHESTRAYIPFVNRTEGESSVALPRSDFCQPIGDTSHSLELAPINKHLELSLWLGATDQEPGALNLYLPGDMNRFSVQISPLSSSRSIQPILRRIVDNGRCR